MPYKDPQKEKEYKAAYYKKNIVRAKRLKKEKYAANRNLAIERSKKWKLLNPDRVSEWKKKYYSTRRHWLVEKQKLWRKNNPEKAKAIASVYKAVRRGREKNAKGVCTSQQFLSRVEYYGWRCFYCKIILDAKNLTADHRIPLSKGGTNWASNLVPSCKSCNCSKHDKMPNDVLVLIQEN